MRNIFVVAAVVVVALFVLIGLAALIGSRLPIAHVASGSIRLNQPTEEVYRLVRDVASAPSWRSDVTSVELLGQPNGKPQYREHGKQGDVTYELMEDLPGQRMVTRIVDQDLGYSGTWTIMFAADSGGTRVTITENGEVSNVLFRVMSRYVFGHTSTIDSYLKSLAKHFREEVSPQ